MFVFQCLTVAKSFLPHLIPKSWPTVSIPLWTGMLEGCLLPIVLAMSDRTFVRRIAAVYSRRRPSDMTKPPQGTCSPVSRFPPAISTHPSSSISLIFYFCINTHFVYNRRAVIHLITIEMRCFAIDYRYFTN